MYHHMCEEKLNFFFCSASVRENDLWCFRIRLFYFCYPPPPSFLGLPAGSEAFPAGSRPFHLAPGPSQLAWYSTSCLQSPPNWLQVPLSWLWAPPSTASFILNWMPWSNKTNGSHEKKSHWSITMSIWGYLVAHRTTVTAWRNYGVIWYKSTVEGMMEVMLITAFFSFWVPNNSFWKMAII